MSEIGKKAAGRLTGPPVPTGIRLWAGVVLVLLLGGAAVRSHQFDSMPWALPTLAGFGLLAWAIRTTPAVLRGIPPLTPQGLGLFRVFLALALVPVVRHEAAPSLPLSPDQVRVDANVIRWDFFLDERSADVLSVAHAVMWPALALFAIGLCTRLAYAVFAGSFVFQMLAIAQIEAKHAFAMLLFTLVALLVAPWHHSISLDETIRRLIGRRPSATVVPLGIAVWLPGLALGIGVAAAAYAKLHNGGFEWIATGAAGYYAVDDYHNAVAPGLSLFLGSHQYAAIAASAATILFEALFVLHAFNPDWRARLGAFAVGAGFFLGLLLAMGIRWTAWWLLLLGLLPWNEAATAVGNRLRPRVVLLDGRCPMCLRTGRILHAVDLFDRLSFVDANDAAARARYAPHATLEDVRREMLVSDDRGAVHAGVAAYREIARCIPLLWPVLALLRLPGAEVVSEGTYRAIARRRRLCTDTCDATPVWERPATRRSPRFPRIAAFVVPLIVSFAVTQQVTISGLWHDLDPLFSNFPMYSGADYEDVAFDERAPWPVEASLRLYGGAGETLTTIDSRLRTIPDGSETVAARLAAAKAGRVPTALECEQGRIIAGAWAAAFGTDLRIVESRLESRGFDFAAGEVIWTGESTPVATLDVERCAVVQPA